MKWAAAASFATIVVAAVHVDMVARERLSSRDSCGEEAPTDAESSGCEQGRHDMQLRDHPRSLFASRG